MQKEIRFHHLNDEDYLRELNSLVKQLRNPEERGSLDFKSFLMSVKRAERETARKVKRGEAVSEHEKWLFENAYLVSRAAEKYSEKAIALPSKGGEPRIVSILRFALYNRNDFTKEHLIATLNTVQAETALNVAEIEALGAAFAYVLSEGISIVAERIVYHDKMKYRAECEPSDSTFFVSDIYNYYLLRIAESKEKVIADLCAHGVNYRGAEAAFTMSVVENDELAQKFFTLLRCIDELTPLFDTLPTTETYKTLAKAVGFKKMSFDTQCHYLRFVSDAAKSLKKNEVLIAEKLFRYSEATGGDIGEVVFRKKRGFRVFVRSGKIIADKERTNARESAYFALLTALSIVSAVIVLLITQSYFSLFLLIPLFFFAENAVNRILGKIRKHRFLPRMNFREIPPQAATLVAVSEYIVSAEQLKDSVRRLKILKAGNGAGAVEFALLIDFAAADTEEKEGDAELIAYLQSALTEAGFNAFVRKRVKSGARYSGRERKRGAIEDLSFMLETGNGDAFRFILKTPKKPEYVVLLDNDNTIEPSGILDMVNMISHPANARYDLLSACGRYRLETPKTVYSKRFYREGGLENYPHYSSFFFDLFGKDIFCGKGIYRLKSYLKKISGIFPDGKVLSHDILEGSVMSTASGGVVYEEAPETFLQEEERVTRWQRGDIQLLPFLFRGWKNAEKQKYRSEIPLFYRLLMLRNVLNILSPIFLFASFVLGLFINPALTVAATAVAFLPFAVDFIFEVRTLNEKRRLRYVLKSVLHSLGRTLQEFFLLPYRALKNLAVFVTTTINMCSGKNLLLWKTFYMSKSACGAAVLFKMASIPLISCTVILVFLFLFAMPSVIPFAILTAATLVVLTALCAASAQIQARPIKNKEFLQNIAEKTCKYFDLMRSSGLPADNFQERPYRGKSKTTSPTNMGFAAIADICAFYLGYRDREETCALLLDSVRKFMKLKKWKGNLYNWYALDGAPLGNFVSGVDSGNFLGCMTVINGFAEEIGEQELFAATETLICETELGALYDKEKKQMFLGYDVKTKKFGGHYDMLMSESRLTSYLQAARSADGTVWRSLGRDYTGRDGNTLLSWSGTMFEYLMTAVFLRAPENSLIAESETRAVRIQSKHRFHGLWGRSEGGYRAFDNELNYQYYAIGDEELSLRSENNMPVVAPYASGLALLKKPAAAIKNFKRFKKIGALGEYGFYESVDFSEGRASIVESYMTHHQGMLLAALTNVLKNDILVKLFLKSVTVSSAGLLLTEKTSERRYPVKVNKIANIIPKTHQEYYTKSVNQEYSEKIFGLTNGKISVFSDNLGNNETRFERTVIARPFTVGTPRGGFFFAETKGGFSSPTSAPLLKRFGEYESGQTESCLFFKNQSSGLFLEIRKNDNFHAVTKRLTIDAPTGKQVRVAYIEELALNDKDAFLSHPTFNGMFIETSYLADKKTLIAEARSKSEGGDRYFALVIKGMDKISVETDRMKLVGRGRTLRNPAILEDFKEEGVNVGEVLEPAFGFSGLTEYSRDGKAIVEVTEFCADSKEELFRLLDTVPREFFRYAEKSVSENRFKEQFVSDFISALFFKKRNAREINKFGAEDSSTFREYSRGGVGIFFRAGQSDNSLRRLIEAIKSAESFGVPVFLNVLTQKSPDGRGGKAIDELAKKMFFNKYRILKGEEDANAAERYCFMSLDEKLSISFADVPSDRLSELRLSTEIAVPLTRESYLIDGENGGFLENGDFLLTKRPALPFSDVVAFRHGGFVATENGGGFAFFGNSRENKQNEFFNDPVSDEATEFLLVGEKSFVRLNKGASATRYMPAKITFYSQYASLKSRVEEYMVDDGRVRVFEAEIDSESKNLSLYYGFRPALDWKSEHSDILFYGENGALRVKNLKTGNGVSVRILSDNLKSLTVSAENERFPWLKAEFAGITQRVFVLISEKDSAIAKLDSSQILSQKAEMLRSVDALGVIKIKTKDDSTDLMVNRWLLPQIYFSRLNARAGFYQAGGAIGFRDQLQDTVALLSSDPSRIREQIILAAHHQYLEGDVQHWWHPPKFGIRTKISDDKLFLVLMTAKYLRATGDKEILKEEIPYLVSAPLAAKEVNRLECPKETSEKEPLLKHCLKALKSAMRYGDNGLLILGTGDWNDGIDDAGKKLKGESVVTSLIFVWAVKEFSDYVEDGNIRVELVTVAEKLKEAIHRNAFRNGQYLRLRADDGKWYGTGEGALKTDLVSESLAVLSGTANREQAESALRAASELVDKENKIIKLLAPPLTKKTYLGYLSKYPKGVRENGGQYTHAAIWYLMALAEVGQAEEAYELFRMINPAEKFKDAAVYQKYRGEPFVLSGDVYASEKYQGRMGWSWYTGAAAWCYHFLTEVLFGVKKLGNSLKITPNLPSRLDGSEMTFRYLNSEYRIIFRKTGTRQLSMDGIRLETEGIIPLLPNKRAEIIAEC